MNIAYLITAYNQPIHLARLIRTLDCESAYFFINVDLKQNISDFKRLIPDKKNIIVLDTPYRTLVYWGGFNMVKSILNMIYVAESLAVAFDRFCLLSGSDYPIKSNKEIIDKLSCNIEYINIVRKLDYKKNTIFDERVRYYHLWDCELVNPKTKLGKFFHWKIARILSYLPRKEYTDFPIYQGSGWWSLTGECVRYIIDFIERNPRFMKFYKYAGIPDESFFHTIVKNSPFCNNISQDFVLQDNESEDNVLGCHYIDWSTGTPIDFEMSHLNVLLDSKALFARKFHETKSSHLLDNIDKVIKDKID